MSTKHKVVHAIGNVVGQHNVEVRGNCLVLYKAVRKSKQGHYYNLYGKHTEYRIGQTFTKKQNAKLGYFLGDRNFVSNSYFATWALQVPDIAILECLVPIASITFDNHCHWRSFNCISSRLALRPDQPFREMQCSKFTVARDVTADVLEEVQEYLGKLRQMLVSKVSKEPNIKSLDCA